MKIKLQDLIDEMDMQNDQLISFYKKNTNEFILYNKYDDSLNEYDMEEIEESDNFLSIPSNFEIHEYDIMKNFCYSIKDEEVKSKTLNAITGTGAFRRFKEMIYGTEYENQWYGYKEAQLKDLAVSWCEENNLEYE